jgi:hypothetical protein
MAVLKQSKLVQESAGLGPRIGGFGNHSVFSIFRYMAHIKDISIITKIFVDV